MFAENGKMLEEYTCSFGKKHGTSKQYYPGGNLKIKEHYQKNILHGNRFIYFANGTLHKAENWKNGARHGLWTILSPKGDTLLNTSFENGSGKIQGFVLFENTWTKTSDTLFNHNKIDSLLTWVDLDKKILHEETWAMDTLISQKLYYLEPQKQLASEGSFSKGLPHGTWLNYYPNGQIKDSLNYKEGERFGHQKRFDEKGNLILHTEEAGKYSPVLFHTSQER